MRIAVFGAGGAGGYFAGRWAGAGRDVILVARGPHLEAMQRSGLTIESPLGDATVPVRAVSPDQDVEPVDLLVVATRLWQLEGAFDAMRRLVGPDTSVLSIQNGVDAADILTRALGPAHVLGGTCRIFSLVEAPGVIRHVAANPVLTFGELGGGRSELVEKIERTLDLGAVARAVASEDIGSDIWRKFLFFAPLGGVGSVTRAPVGAFRSEPESRRLLVAAMEEVHALATAMGIHLSPDSVAETLSFVDALQPSSTSSLQRDFDAGRRTELDWLAGAVVRLGAEHGVPTPVHDMIYAALLPLERRARGLVSW